MGLAIASLILLILLLAAVAVIRHAMLRTCSAAFRQGLADGRTLTPQQIRDRFAGFLQPMRPMDAAAYVRGVRWAMRAGMEPSLAYREFRRAFSSGAITREGASIRLLGADEALRDFRLPRRRTGAAASA